MRADELSTLLDLCRKAELAELADTEVQIYRQLDRAYADIDFD